MLRPPCAVLAPCVASAPSVENRHIRKKKKQGGNPTQQYAKWYGADYTVAEAKEDATDDVTELMEAWDGCAYVEALGESPNVPGLGEVSQVCMGIAHLHINSILYTLYI